MHHNRLQPSRHHSHHDSLQHTTTVQHHTLDNTKDQLILLCHPHKLIKPTPPPTLTNTMSDDEIEITKAPTEEPTEDPEQTKDDDEAQEDEPSSKRKRKRKRKKKANSNSEETAGGDAATSTGTAPSAEDKLNSIDHTVYVEGIPFDCQEAEVKSFFIDNGCKDVLQLRLPT